MQDDSVPAAELRTKSGPGKPSRGRPRATDLESRVFDAAIAIYADGGWRALTFDAVAREAGVGKSALYRRWADRGALLREMLEARWYAIGSIDEGSLRGDLLALARACFKMVAGPYSGVHNHLQADAQAFKDARAATAPYGEQTILQARQIIRRAMARGELAADFNASLLIDIVVGGITNHVTSTPRRLREAMLLKADSYMAELVDVALRGANVGPGQPAEKLLD
jgi:AcrR family transcriptional regulator